MESLTALAARALKKFIRKLRELRTAETRRCNAADQNRLEQGMPIEDMDRSGMRNRLALGQASESANDNPESPSTMSGESGIITPRSDGNPESQGMLASHEVKCEKLLT
jgi:hypothetical protein